MAVLARWDSSRAGLSVSSIPTGTPRAGPLIGPQLSRSRHIAAPASASRRGICVDKRCCACLDCCSQRQQQLTPSLLLFSAVMVGKSQDRRTARISCMHRRTRTLAALRPGPRRMQVASVESTPLLRGRSHSRRVFIFPILLHRSISAACIRDARGPAGPPLPPCSPPPAISCSRCGGQADLRDRRCACTSRGGARDPRTTAKALASEYVSRDCFARGAGRGSASA